MLTAVIVILVILWLLGYSPLLGLSIPNVALFTINNHSITLWEILTLLVISWAISILPKPFQAIASVMLVLWILSILNIFAIPGLASLIVLIFIIGLVASIFL